VARALLPSDPNHPVSLSFPPSVPPLLPTPALPFCIRFLVRDGREGVRGGGGGGAGREGDHMTRQFSQGCSSVTDPICLLFFCILPVCTCARPCMCACCVCCVLLRVWTCRVCRVPESSAGACRPRCLRLLSAPSTSTSKRVGGGAAGAAAGGGSGSGHTSTKAR